MRPSGRVVGVSPAAPVGTIAGVVVGGSTFAVVRHEGGWVLFEDRCTHAGCSFVGEGGEVADGSVLICPCHGSEFDLRDGSVLLGPAVERLDVIPLVARDGELWVE